MGLAVHFVITRAHEQAKLWVQVSVRFTHRTLVVHGLDGMSMGGWTEGYERETDEILGCPSRCIFNPTTEHY
jgi:hypothetical protein